MDRAHAPLSGEVLLGFDGQVLRDRGIPETHNLPEDVLATAKGATFQVFGLACEESRWGTAFVGGKGKLVTSAHVVTGVPFPKVVLGEDALAVRVMAIDRASDIAVLTIDKELPNPLPLANAKSGSVGVVLGYDVSGNLVVRPAGIVKKVLATGGEPPDVLLGGRPSLELAVQVESGFSGGPVLDVHGSVVGVLFARSPDGSTAFAVQTAKVLEVLNRPVATGSSGTPC